MEKKIVKSGLPEIFYGIAILLFLFGGIGGYKFAQPGFLSSDSFNFQLAGIIWASTFITGMIFIGFGRVIDLLVSLNNK